MRLTDTQWLWSRAKRKPWVAQGITLLGLGAVLAGFFLVYVPSRKAALVARNFRVLADVGEQIEGAFSSLHTSLTSAAKFSPGTSESNPAFLESFSNKIEQIDPPLVLVKAPADNSGGPFFCSEIAPERLLRDPCLRLTYSNSSNKFAVRVSLVELLRPMLSRYEFADLLLTRTNGDVLFQASEVELRATNHASVSDLVISRLPGSRSSRETNSVAEATSLREMDLAGNSYTVFSQPLRIALGTESASHADWLVCGLVRSSQFAKETWAMSPTVTVLFMFLASGLLLLWPFLNVAFCGPVGEIRSAQVAAVLVGSLCACAALSFFIMFTTGYISSKNELDGQLKQLAGDVQQHFQEELRHVDAALTSLDGELYQRACSSEEPDTVAQRGDILSVVPQLSTNYPAFLDVAWLDSDGRQVIKWSPQHQVMTLVSVSDRPYFQSLIQHWAWPRAAFVRPPASADGFFYLESVFSKTRNQNIAVFARPCFLDDRRSDSAWPDSRPKPTISAITFRPLSLSDPLLPVGFGFCIVEPNGRVVFHSESQHNLRENLIVETGHCRRLLAAIDSRTEDDFDCHYLGETYHMFVMPIAGIPWTLVTFRNAGLLAASHRMTLLSGSLLFAVYLVFLLLLAIPWVFVQSSGPRIRRICWFSWLWPKSLEFERYSLRVLMGLVAAFFCLAGTLVSDSTLALIGWGIAGPVIALGGIRLIERACAYKAGFQRAVSWPICRIEGFLGRLSWRHSARRDGINRLAHLVHFGGTLLLLGSCQGWRATRSPFSKRPRHSSRRSNSISPGISRVVRSKTGAAPADLRHREKCAELGLISASSGSRTSGTITIVSCGIQVTPMKQN